MEVWSCFSTSIVDTLVCERLGIHSCGVRRIRKLGTYMIHLLIAERYVLISTENIPGASPPNIFDLLFITGTISSHGYSTPARNCRRFLASITKYISQGRPSRSHHMKSGCKPSRNSQKGPESSTELGLPPVQASGGLGSTVEPRSEASVGWCSITNSQSSISWRSSA